MPVRLGADIKRVLVAPLDWGLGHASRCVPIINEFLRQGKELVIASTGQSGELLRREFPTLRHIELPGFTMRYSKGKSQVWAILRALPSIICYSFKEHKAIKRIVEAENIDLVVSDNRFGLWCSNAECVYITHQLMIKCPRALRFAEPLLHWAHVSIAKRYARCWIPDSPAVRLAGDLAHKYKLPANAEFIGVLSRMEAQGGAVACDSLAVLSGVEPLRSIFEQELLECQQKREGKVVLVEGLPNSKEPRRKIGKVEVIPYLQTEELQAYMRGAKAIICRSGYSSIMDLYAMGKLNCAELYPTPGQSEQEYLAAYHKEKKLSKTSKEDIFPMAGK